MSEHSMTLTAHLEEIRRRLMVSAAAVTVGAVVCGLFSSRLLDLLVLPLSQGGGKLQLIYTAPADGFMAIVKLAVLGGILLASPIILGQIWGFTAPALYPHEKRRVIPLLFWSVFLFLSGAGFCWFLFPQLFIILSSYGTEHLTPLYSVSEYTAFILQLSLAFGAAFQLPVITQALTSVGILTSRKLIDGGRYAVVIIFIAAAVLTPPDVLSQMILAVPLLLLYGISIVLARISERRVS